MLQQTTVATVRGRFAALVARWPDVQALATAPLEDVLAAWAGLGYYARARNLLACARVVAGELNGRFPDSVAALQRLPGIGPYTATAIASIAFDVPVAALDANVERVMARLFAIDTPLPAGKREIAEAARALIPKQRPGDFNQAGMDLGAAVCRARNPRCDACPLMADCAAHRCGIAETLPRKAKKKPRPMRHGDAYWIERTDGAVLLRRRAPRGMLGGMVEIPSGGWDGGDAPWGKGAPFGLSFAALEEPVRHVFTHFALDLTVWRASRPLPMNHVLPDGFFWQPRKELQEAGLPTLMRKVVRRVLSTAP